MKQSREASEDNKIPNQIKSKFEEAKKNQLISTFYNTKAAKTQLTYT